MSRVPTVGQLSKGFGHTPQDRGHLTPLRRVQGGQLVEKRHRVRAARRLVEQVHRRAFNKSTADGWPGVFAHSDDYLLGTTGAGTLRLNIDERGLLYEVDVPECRSDTLEMVSCGDISKNSFAFQCFEDEWAYWNGQPLRNLFSRRLIDVPR